METSQIVGAAKCSRDSGTTTVAARVTVKESHEPEQLNEILILRKLLRRC